MEFTLLSSASLTFANDGRSQDNTMNGKVADVLVDKLEAASSASFNKSNLFLTKLEGLLLAQPSREGKRQRLSQPIDSRLRVRIFYGPLSPAAPNRMQTGYCMIFDFSESNGLFKRLVGVCGGQKNIKAELELKFGTKEDKMKLSLDFGNQAMSTSNNFCMLGQYFNFSVSLAQKWNTQAKFTGTASLILKLNGEALNLIHGGTVEVADLVTRKLLANAMESGDGIIVVGNGMEIRCHKVFLSAQSDVFKAMFNSNLKKGKCSNRVTMGEMSEDGVKALLGYLYCCDIQAALSSSLIALELLIAADKYEIVKLLETMRELILGMANDWFSVDAAVQLLILVKNRAESPDFKEMEQKAKSVLRSKPLNELKQCAEFRELFDNSDNAMEMCAYLMQNP